MKLGVRFQPARPTGTALSSGRVPRSGGFVLLAVLIVIMMASMVATSTLFRMRAEETDRKSVV